MGSKAKGPDKVPATGKSDLVQVLGGKQVQEAERAGSGREPASAHNKRPGAVTLRSPSRKEALALGPSAQGEQGPSQGPGFVSTTLMPRRHVDWQEWAPALERQLSHKRELEQRKKDSLIAIQSSQRSMRSG